MSKIIKAKGICKSYDSVKVLKGIDIEIERGEMVAIVGPSGAGKTTLLQILGALETPDSGSINWRAKTGKRVLTWEPPNPYSSKDAATFHNRHVGFVFQFHQLLPEFTLLENVMMPALIGGASQADAEAKARHLIDYLDLTKRVSHRPNQLSGGERQRAAVARALVNDPDIVLADEPSGSLDSVNRDELHLLFIEIQRDMGTTFLIVTHDNDFAADADRIIQLVDGEIVS